ncbi:hypothetical protein KCP75_21150 [Salmonella enterica subsp. enterica]|nr:hypothetical protein KCP75_21150 [Salmonella enterica subsp. enterica]
MLRTFARLFTYTFYADRDDDDCGLSTASVICTCVLTQPALSDKNLNEGFTPANRKARQLHAADRPGQPGIEIPIQGG